ncbi:MAG: hypothetical protein R2692_09535 [Microbacterium sp.]
MTASLFVALTIVPVLAYWFLKPGKPVVDAAGNEIDPEDPAAPPSRLQPRLPARARLDPEALVGDPADRRPGARRYARPRRS